MEVEYSQEHSTR